MRSKNKPKPTAAERRHIERVAALACVVCDAPGPSEVHEPEQSLWFAAIALCPACCDRPGVRFTAPEGWQ